MRHWGSLGERAGRPNPTPEESPLKRILHAAGVMAAAATLCLTTATSAGATTGALVLNGERITNPHGCYNSDRWPLSVGNETNEAVTIYNGSDCSGSVEIVLAPGSTAVSEFGQSVYVP